MAQDGDAAFENVMNFLATYTPENNTITPEVHAELLKMARTVIDLEDELEATEEFVNFTFEAHRKELEKFRSSSITSRYLFSD